MIIVIEQIRIIACFSMLVLASVIDVKKREIPDKIWIGFGALGILLFLVDFSFTTAAPMSLLFKYLLGIGIISPIAYLVYRTSLFGGADSKALVAIAVLIPSYDTVNILRSVVKIHDFPALTVLCNGVIISMSHVVYNSLRNLIAISKGVPIFEGFEESVPRKILAFAMGFRSKSPTGYMFAMEGVDESGKRKFRFNPAAYDDFVTSDEGGNESNGEKSIAAASITSSGKDIWVTQALPFIVFIAIGLALMLGFGDLMAFFFKQIAG